MSFKFIFFLDEIGCFPGSDCLKICGHRNGCSNMAYPKLVIDLMPSGTLPSRLCTNEM